MKSKCNECAFRVEICDSFLLKYQTGKIYLLIARQFYCLLWCVYAVFQPTVA